MFLGRFGRNYKTSKVLYGFAAINKDGTAPSNGSGVYGNDGENIGDGVDHDDDSQQFDVVVDIKSSVDFKGVDTAMQNFQDF